MIAFAATWWLFPMASLLLIGFSLYLTRAGGLQSASLRKAFVAFGALLGLLALALPSLEQPALRHPLVNYGLGIPLAVVGLVGRIYPMFYLQRRGTTTTMDGVATLVETGPYSWVRHPQYTFGFLLLFGWFLVWGALYSLGMLPLLAGTIYVQALIEEKYVLETQFGDAYAVYRERTGMLIPRVLKTEHPLRITVSFLGIFAGILGIQHGFFEILQGNAVTDGVMFSAIGPPCQPEAVWHGCYPAMSLIPDLSLTGIAAVIAGLLLLLWVLFFVQRKRGPLTLSLLSFLLLLVGGGFVPVFVGLVAAVASRGLHRPVPPPRFAVLARVWPWPLVVMAAWMPGSWLLGYLLPTSTLVAGGMLFLVFDVGLPVLAALSGVARGAEES